MPAPPSRAEIAGKERQNKDMKFEIKTGNEPAPKDIKGKLWLDLKRLGSGILSTVIIAFVMALQFIIMAIGFILMMAHSVYGIFVTTEVKNENNEPAVKKKRFNFNFHFEPRMPGVKAKSVETGAVYAELTLINYTDAVIAGQEPFKENAVRRLTVQAVVCPGKWTVIINEETREKLGLAILGIGELTLADGQKAEYPLAGPLEVLWNNRGVVCPALVIPGAPICFSAHLFPKELALQ
jgi:hypothetical protein